MGEHTHFTVVFERPEGYEDVHVELCAEDFINPPSNVRYEWFDGNLAQQRDELAEALGIITDQLERVGDTRYHKDGQFIEEARAVLAKVRGEGER